MLRVMRAVCVVGGVLGLSMTAQADMIFLDNFSGPVTTFRTTPFITDTGDPTNAYQRVDMLADGTARTLSVASLGGADVTGRIGGGSLVVLPPGPYLTMLDYNFGGIDLTSGEYLYGRTVNLTGSGGIRLDFDDVPAGTAYTLGIGFGDPPLGVGGPTGGSVTTSGTFTGPGSLIVPLSSFAVKDRGYINYGRVGELALIFGSDVPIDPTLTSVGITSASDPPPPSAVPAPPTIVLSLIALPILLLRQRNRWRSEGPIAEPGAAADRAGHVGSWGFIAHSGRPGC